MFKKYIKDGKIINATEKAYRVVFRGLGYKLYKGIEQENGAEMMETMTKAEIIDVLTQRGIKHDPRDRKEKLIELLAEGD